MPSSTWRAQAANSWPSVTGTASIMWVRPTLTMSSHSAARAASDACSVPQRRDQALHRLDGGDVHHGRETVVGGLAAIDVIVRMHRRARAARLAEHFVGAVGDHLVGVHVGLRAGAGLPHRQREFVVPLAVGDLARGGDDRLGDVARQFAELQVGLRRRLFLQADGADQARREVLRADAEQAARPLGLRAPVARGIDVDAPPGGD